MLGYLRFALAVLVSFNHLWVIYGVGRLAVFSFYVISGYLMTAIIRETYGTTATGLARYATNRLLRIYPTYLIVFFFAAATFTLFERSELLQFDSSISTPSTLIGWLKNSTLIGLDFSTRDRTIPPGWTLFVELFYYALIPALLLIGPRIFVLWLTIAIGYHAFVILNAHPSDASIAWETRYGSIAAGGLGFAIGACARLYLPAALKTKNVFFMSLVLFCSCYVLAAYWALSGMKPEINRILSTVGYYGAMLSVAPIIDYLARLPTNKISERFGEYSYPFYLVHIPVGFLVFHALGAEGKNTTTLTLGIVASLLCSWALIKIDRYISNIRNLIREKKNIRNLVFDVEQSKVRQEMSAK